MSSYLVEKGAKTLHVKTLIKSGAAWSAGTSGPTQQHVLPYRALAKGLEPTKT
jgi:hypothetical protein